MHGLVKDLMTTQVVTVAPATPFKEIVARLATHRVSVVPVVNRLTYGLDDSPFMVPSDLLIDRAPGVPRRTWQDCP